MWLLLLLLLLLRPPAMVPITHRCDAPIGCCCTAGIVEVPSLLLRPVGPSPGLPWLGTGAPAVVPVGDAWV